MKKYQCTIYSHIYDPAVGDPARNIPRGTPFEDLPQSGACLVCGANKSLFREVLA